MQLDWQTPYDTWKQTGTAEALGSVVKSLRPIIDGRMAGMGAAREPLLASHAQLITADAVRTWDPSKGAALPTWVNTQLGQLNRVRRNSGVIHIPERQQMDALRVYQAEAEIRDETGEDPTTEQLADRAHISTRRLSEIRARTRPVIGEGSIGQNAVEGKPVEFSDEALDLVYGDVDKLDKLVLEHRTGYRGAKLLNTADLMSRTGLDQFQLARRVMKLNLKVHKMQDDLRRVYGGGT